MILFEKITERLFFVCLFTYSGLCLRTGGTEGLFSNKTLEITNDVLASYKNQGWLPFLFLFILDMFLSMDDD
jgi:hypothetical protein